MRIISGSRKGLKLYSPKGGATRPTEDRIKESLFNILGNVTTSNVLDLFAGSGSIGLEFLSRGANKVILVENNRESLQTIKKNIEKVNLSGVEVLDKDYSVALQVIAKIGDNFDYIYIDPPYDKIHYYENSLKFISKDDSFRDSLIILESNAESPIKNLALFKEVDQRRYRDTVLYFLRRK